MNSKQLLLYVSLVFVLIIGGCGGGGKDLVGSLELTATTVNDTGGWYHVEATAKYSHPSKDVLGSEIIMAISMYTLDASGVKTIIGTSSQPVSVNTSGEFTLIYPKVQQKNVPIFADVTARIGDLSQFASVTIPAVAPIAVTPTFFNFTSPGTKTATISGGVTPYTVFSTPAGVTATVTNTTTLTVSISTFQALSGTIIVQSAIDEISIPINY